LYVAMYNLNYISLSHCESCGLAIHNTYLLTTKNKNMDCEKTYAKFIINE